MVAGLRDTSPMLTDGVITLREPSEDDADATQTAIGYYYPISKRTWLFSQVGEVRNSGTARFGLGPARVEQLAAGLREPGRDIAE